MSAILVYFEGDPPPVSAGDVIEVRTTSGEWHRKVAKSAPRYDEANARGGRCYLTVSVTHEGLGHDINWPTEDVRPTHTEETS